MQSPDVSALFKPIRINETLLSNRVVLGPMAANSPEADGRPGKQTEAFFETRARGGVGLIIVGGMIAGPRGYDEAPAKPVLRLDRDDFIEDYRRVGQAVHAHGVPIIAEIMPGFGRMGRPSEHRPLISASPMNVVIPEANLMDGLYVPGGITTPLPREATLEEIKTYEKDMIDAAIRVQKAGWDGVEVAAHMSYFMASFLTDRTNKRTDEYGGSRENRARMLVNIVAEIRRLLPADFIVGLRICANDYMPDGQGPEEFAAVAKLVEAAGIDYAALSPGCYEVMYQSARSRDGGMVEDGTAQLFKDTLSVPILVQGVHNPVSCASVIEQGKADMIMLARPLLADPDWTKKVKAGRNETINVCKRDNYCVRRMILNMPVRCDVNPQMGRESRQPGARAPAVRLIRTPFEWSVLKLTGSKRLMGFASRLAARRKKATSESTIGITHE